MGSGVAMGYGVVWVWGSGVWDMGYRVPGIHGGGYTNPRVILRPIRPY